MMMSKLDYEKVKSKGQHPSEKTAREDLRVP